MNDRKEYQHQWYEKNKERILQKNRIYSQTHKDEIRGKKKQYRAGHREQYRMYALTNYYNHREYRLERGREYSQSHHEHLQAYQKDHTAGIWGKFLDLHGRKCAYCGYSENVLALVCHHTDPSRKINNQDWKRTGRDNSDLILLCANCHTILHRNC